MSLLQNRVRKATAILVLSLFTVTCAVPTASFAANSIGDLQQKQSELNSEKKNVKNEINAKNTEKKSLTEQLKDINQQMNDVQQTIDGLNTEISETEEKISFTEMEISNKQRDYDGRMAIFNQRLKEMYQYGDVNFLEVLLQSSSITDFLTRFEYLKYIANNDQKLLDEVSALKASLETEKASLDSMKTSLVVKRQNQEAKSKELATASAQKQSLVDQINAEQDALYDILEDLEAESKALNSEIKRLQAEQAAKNGANTKAPGAYLWPCPSSHTITSNYGYRVHPVTGAKKLHSGMDIGASYGVAVVAAASGTVIMSKYYGGYGNCIIIDHGGGVSTLYGHMSSLIAKTGQKVSAGETIGKVGSTGVSTGNHLHFEVRINGSTVNPANYV